MNSKQNDQDTKVPPDVADFLGKVLEPNVDNSDSNNAKGSPNWKDYKPKENRTSMDIRRAMVGKNKASLTETMVGINKAFEDGHDELQIFLDFEEQASMLNQVIQGVRALGRKVHVGSIGIQHKEAVSHIGDYDLNDRFAYIVLKACDPVDCKDECKCKTKIWGNKFFWT